MAIILNPRRASRNEQGATLIELVIGMVITGILLAAGMPSFSEWIQNTKIRTSAEVIQNGMQMARTEAIRLNTNMVFTLTDSAGTSAWTMACASGAGTDTCKDVAKTQSAAEGSMTRVGIMTTADISSANALAAGAGLPASVTFNALGRVTGSNNITRADVIYPGVSTARRMSITVSPGGQVRMCDPGRASTDPQGC